MIFAFSALILVGVGLAQRSATGVSLGLLALLPVCWYLLATPYGLMAVCVLVLASAGMVAALGKGYEGIAWGLYLVLVALMLAGFYWTMLTTLPPLELE
jgi:hypothetical protein